MIASYGLLLVFTAMWLHSQLNNEKNQLSKDLAKLFTNVQEQITDSLLAVRMIQPDFGSNSSGQEPVARATFEIPAAIKENPAQMMGLRKLLQDAQKISGAEEKQLFRLDTVVFNEIFTGRMKQNGWNFTSKWVSSQDSGKNAEAEIFIQSNFFTHEHGVVVSHFDPYLWRKMLPPLAFVLVLLTVTGLAFRIVYNSLNEQLKLGKMKDDFVSNMSHELKTPIATVKMTLEALHHFDVIEQPELSREYLEMAMQEMERLELLAGKALHTSLLESGRLVLQPEQCDLEQLVMQVVQAYQLKLQQHEATIAVHSIGQNFFTMADPLHTQGVLINLLDNSLKYGVAPVRIQIVLREQEDGIQLTVTDNGPGIPETYRDRVFEKFFRVPNENRHNTRGYGLGLNYAAQVMAQQHGDIQVENMSEGGCRFTLTF
ncbi:sensor histidine kinase [Chitinophagaceae bacterium MMS25-I14]